MTNSPQLTLGQLILKLEGLDENKKIRKISAHSYRGYYAELAFELSDELVTVRETLNLLKENCLNKSFTGYKGGDWVMTSSTFVWCAEYSKIGNKIIDIFDGEIVSFTLA